jgi:hypothetical protein
MTKEKLRQVVETMLQRYSNQRMLTKYDPEGRKVGHLGHMLISLRDKNFSEAKAQRWLGYAQCLSVFYGLYTLDELRQLNKEEK